MVNNVTLTLSKQYNFLVKRARPKVISYSLYFVDTILGIVSTNYSLQSDTKTNSVTEVNLIESILWELQENLTRSF